MRSAEGGIEVHTFLYCGGPVTRQVWFAVLTLAFAAPLDAQSLLYRPANLGGTWVVDPGVVQFNFVHRFYVAPGPSHAVVNFPNFTVASGFGHQVAFGAHFATKSIVGLGNGAQSTNETEVDGRWRVHGAEGQPGVAGGFNARLNPYIGVSADVGSFVSPTVRAAWSAAINFLIPSSPHTFSLQSSNAGGASIQGASQGIAAPKNILYGFEFTIPLHLKRFAPWFHGSPKPVALGASGAAIAAEVDMAAVKFTVESVTISAGQAVRWTNRDPVEHTVTFDGAAEPGSPVIPPNGSYVHRFDKRGTYMYHCTPHPFMKGVVVVK